MARQARWLLPNLDPGEVETLSRALGMGMPAASVLWGRGFRDAASARRFLCPSLDDLHDPLAMRGMDCAVERLTRAIRNRENILIYGDYDVDGATAVVILKRSIELAGGVADFHVPDRLKDGYGMRPEVVATAAERGVSLIISVDTGIRAAEVVRRARELAIDVIITDHHLPEAELPPALAVLNPNRPDCAYPEKNLCGVGVAFKLVQALVATLDWPPQKRRRILESFLKLVAIGTVADVVPLTGENRIIVKHGLSGLRDVRNPGLRALLDVAGFSGGSVPTATEVAFRIAPRMNAAGRMATANDVIEMLLTADAGRARVLAEQLHALNTERQKTEADIVETILTECARLPMDDAQAALVFCAPDWHRGVLGIVASRLVERFHRPVFVLSEDRDTGLAQGSGRSITRFHLLDALESMPEMFVKFGGHSHAAGVTLAASNVAMFRRDLQSYAALRLTPEDFAPEVEIDAVMTLRDISQRTVTEISTLAPFGCGHPAPRFAALDAEVAGVPVIWKEKHLRVPLRQQGRTLWLKAWNFAERASELPQGALVDAAFSLEQDSYAAANGMPGWSVVLRDVRPAGMRI
jgi:single-stranded-DNA-specific exonuclease